MGSFKRWLREPARRFTPARFFVPVTSLVAALLPAPQNVSAQSSTAAEQPTSPALAEVIVTAERRAESIDTVPLSVTAVTGDEMRRLGQESFFDVTSAIPNLALGTGAGAGGNGNGFGVSSTRAVAIRGVAGNNTTAFYIDDTPVPVSLDPRMLDVERIEILRGPQGTLFGASSMGGTVRLITREAASDSSGGRVELEGYDMDDGGGGYSALGNLNWALVPDAVGLRANVFSAFTPGYFTREWGIATFPLVPLPPGAPSGEKTHVGSNQETGASVTMKITPPAIPGLTVSPIFLYQKEASNGYPVADYTPENLVQQRPLDVPEGFSDQWSFTGVTAKYERGWGHFIGSFTYFYRRAGDDEDGTDWLASTPGLVPSTTYPGAPYVPYYIPSPSINYLFTKSFTGELRFESSLAGPVQFILGAYSDLIDRRFYEIEYSYGINQATDGAITGAGFTDPDLFFDENAPNADRQRALFIDLEYKLTEALRLSAGVRRTYTSHEFDEIALGWGAGGYFQTSGEAGEYNTTPRYTASYQLAPDDMVYASAAKGFRIGGSNFELPPICEASLEEFNLTNGAPFTSDSLWSYELGTKNGWDEDRIRTRLAAFRIDWNKIQQTIFLPCTFEVTVNSGSAVSEGGEFEADLAPLPGLTVNLSAGYTDAKITEAAPGGFTYVGQPLNDVPKWNGSTSVQYSFPLSSDKQGFVRGQYISVGRSYSFVNAPLTGRVREPYELLHLRAGLDSGPWEFAAFCRNVFNTRGNLGDLLPETGELPGRPRWFITEPRTIGLYVRRSF